MGLYIQDQQPTIRLITSMKRASTKGCLPDIMCFNLEPSTSVHYIWNSSIKEIVSSQLLGNIWGFFNQDQQHAVKLWISST
jgi:hypothetical protein